MNTETLRQQLQTIIQGKSFYLQVRPEDSLTLFSITESDLIGRITRSMPAKYRNKLKGFRKGTPCDILPVFDETTQRQWDNELNEYIDRKAEWIRKHGCD